MMVKSQARAQGAPPVQPVQLDPSDIFLQSYLLRRAADQLEKDGDFIGAWDKMAQAQKLIETIQAYHPDWKKSMVEGRYQNNEEASSELRPKADKQRMEKRGALAELEGGVVKPGRFIDPAEGVAPLTPGILEVDPLETRRLQDAEAEVKRLRGLLANPDEGARDASRLRDVERQRDALASQLRAAEAKADALRAQLSASPVQNELKGLNDRIQALEMEGEAMRRALGQSREANLEAETRRQTLEADLTAMRKQAAEMKQKQANLDRDLKEEREVANSVVAGQRKQLEDLAKQLEEKDGQLREANEEIANLKLELRQSHEASDQLREEKEALLQEREQMAALLKLNEAGRITDLIEQNMGLSKQLREANEKVELLNRDNNAAKDDYTDALRDLAIAKTQINRLHQEKQEQSRRLAELEDRLKREEGALARGESPAGSEEADLLREIIKRQLQVQERRKQARDLMVEAAKELGSKDERLAKAIELFEADEIVLSPEEQKLMADRNVDGHFISPFARDRETVGRATADLEREERSYERAATKAFAAERYFPAKELFQMMVESNPGDTSALCKLGVVQLKLEDRLAAVDAFRRATELDPGSAYAHRMLGYSLMSLGDYAAAQGPALRATEIAPDDALACMLMATIYFRQGQTGEAETYYKAAISADPVQSDPYFNLAYLCAKDQRLDDARGYYEKALERGAVPDPSLEKRIQR